MAHTEPFDLTRRCVRITRTRENDLIEFDFFIGDPDVSVEMIMPRPALEEFCRIHQVQVLADDTANADPATPRDWDWNLRHATHQRFR